jgi:hypothetical protein
MGTYRWFQRRALDETDLGDALGAAVHRDALGDADHWPSSS